MNKSYKIIFTLGIIVSILLPQVLVLAQDPIVVYGNERENNSPVLPLNLAKTAQPTVEEAKKSIQDRKDNPPEEIPYTSNLNQEGLKNAEIGNCFDVYKFNNIHLNLSLDQNEYEPAGFIRLKGNIQNKNNYPIPDLKIKGKIVKINQEGDRNLVKTVEEIVIKDNINLVSLGSEDIDEIYNLPIKVAKGEYGILLTVVQNDQISIAGLSFTDDVYAFNPSFKIGGTNIESVSIKQKEITINDAPYNNLSFSPKYKEKKPITIKVPIQNNTNTDKEVELEYEVYSWSDDTGKIKKELKQLTTIPKQGTSIVSYTIEEMKEAVYYLKVKVKDSNVASNISWGNIANIRFVNEDINEPRIAAVTMNTSPYSPEKELQLVTCIHNTNESGVDTILENTIKDEKGRIIASSEYKGTVTGQVDGIYTKLPKNKAYNKLLVTSVIKDKDGNILNTVQLNYEGGESDVSKSMKYNNNLIPIIGSVFGISLLIITVVIFSYKRYKDKKKIQ
jgi:hypothetical protein